MSSTAVPHPDPSRPTSTPRHAPRAPPASVLQRATRPPAILAVVGHGLAPAQRALVAANVSRLIPYYYLNGINLLGYGVLQSRKAFVRSALIPIATPLLIMTLVGSFGADLDVLIGSLTLG